MTPPVPQSTSESPTGPIPNPEVSAADSAAFNSTIGELERRLSDVIPKVPLTDEESATPNLARVLWYTQLVSDGCHWIAKDAIALANAAPPGAQRARAEDLTREVISAAKRILSKIDDSLYAQAEHEIKNTKKADIDRVQAEIEEVWKSPLFWDDTFNAEGKLSVLAGEKGELVVNQRKLLKALKSCTEKAVKVTEGRIE